MQAGDRPPGEAPVGVKLVNSACVVAFGAFLVAAGCTSDLFNRDQDALDKFSHAYTDFLDAGETAEGLWDSLGSEKDPFGFWMALTGALNPESNDDLRLAYALTAIDAYDQKMTHMLQTEAKQVDVLDGAVQKLFERANAIHSTEFRADAAQIAKHAREAQSSFAQGHELIDRRSRLQRRMLDDIVNAGGSLGRAFKAQSLKVELDETIKISDELQPVANRSTTAMHNLKDTFSALKGKTNLKDYPAKVSSQDNAAGRSAP
jgi:hypothetical protein